MNIAFALYDFAVGMFLALAHVFLDHAHPFDDRALLLGQNTDDAAAFAFFRAGDHHHLVAFFDM